MDKILEFLYSKDEKLIKKYKYLIMLNLGQKDLKKLAEEDKKVGKYKMELESVNVTIGINDWISEEQDKEFMRNTLLEAGYENGKEDGKKDGLKQGLEQGRKTQKEFIINLHKLDTPIEIIAKASNLSIKEVESILGI